MGSWTAICNIKKYNVEDVFKKLNTIDWKQTTNVEIGDIIYIYVGQPIGAIKYKCKVNKVNLPVCEIDDSEFVIDGRPFENKSRYMEIELLYEYGENAPTYKELLQNGLKTVQGPSKVSNELESFLSKFESKDGLCRDNIDDNIVIIKVNKLYRKNMAKQELYEITRGYWKRKIESVKKAEYCLSVANGIVVEVYQIDDWFMAGEIPMVTRTIDYDKVSDRIEFVGEVAEANIREKYIGKSITRLFKPGEANPVKVILKNDKYDNILDAEQMISYNSIYEALNASFGTEYTGWMKATWPNNSGNGNFRVWFPKLAEHKNGELFPAAFGCVNTITDDWNEIVYDDLKNTQADLKDKYWGYDLIFAKEPKEGPYIFRGVYIRDKDKSSPNHDVSKRIGTKVKIIGSPASDIEILDDFRSTNKSNDINDPIKPLSMINDNDKIIVTCGRCKCEFLKAPRCPECGQLINYTE